MRVILSILFVAVVHNSWAIDSATTQPARVKPKGIQCEEKQAAQGLDGKCQVETGTSTWELDYLKQGNEKTNWSGKKITNALLIFHPRGNNYRVYEYWSQMVGPKKPIDTEQWVVFSVGTLGDSKPSQGSPILLTIDEMLQATTRLVDYIFPEGEMIVGGGSDGGRLAILWTIANPKRVKKLFLTGIHGLPVEFDKKTTDVFEDSLGKREKELGPFAYWPKDQKLDFWRGLSKPYVEISYTDEYFRTPALMSEQGADPKNFKSPEQFRAIAVDAWASYFRDNLDPHWFLAQIRAIHSGMYGLTEASFSKLPKKIFCLLNPRDQFTVPSQVDEFLALLRKVKKEITTVSINDVRGHIACCEGNVPPELAKGITAFLRD